MTQLAPKVTIAPKLRAIQMRCLLSIPGAGLVKSLYAPQHIFELIASGFFCFASHAPDFLLHSFQSNRLVSYL